MSAEATAAAFKAPAVQAADDDAFVEAWAKSVVGEVTVSDDDVANWFAERRGMARMLFQDEATAAQAKTEVEADIAGGKRPLEAFIGAKRKRRGNRDARREEVAPDGVLVDAAGRTETGEQVLPEDAARILFALEADGAISAPTKVGDLWVVVMRVGVRPGTPLAQVPADQRKAAADRLIAQRSMDKLDEHVARLRRDQGVKIDEAAVRAYAKSLGVEHVSKLRRMPFGARKVQLGRQAGPPERAPIRPAGRDIERLMHERARQKMGEGTPQNEGPGSERSPAPGGQP